MDAELISLLFNLGSVVVLLAIGYGVGSWLETRHFESIRLRERSLIHLPALTFRQAPPGHVVHEGTLVMGSVVVSLDYFKRFLAGLRSIFGGRIRAYEPLMDRARREALLRMKEEARRQGYDAVIDVRMETSKLASTQGNGDGTAGVEILAFGTAVKWDRPA